MAICGVVASESLLTYSPVRSGGIPRSAWHLTIPEQAPPPQYSDTLLVASGLARWPSPGRRRRPSRGADRRALAQGRSARFSCGRRGDLLESFGQSILSPDVKHIRTSGCAERPTGPCRAFIGGLAR